MSLNILQTYTTVLRTPGSVNVLNDLEKTKEKGRDSFYFSADMSMHFHTQVHTCTHIHTHPLYFVSSWRHTSPQSFSPPRASPSTVRSPWLPWAKEQGWECFEGFWRKGMRVLFIGCLSFSVFEFVGSKFSLNYQISFNLSICGTALLWAKLMSQPLPQELEKTPSHVLPCMLPFSDAPFIQMNWKPRLVRKIGDVV